MKTENLIPIEQLCNNYNVEISFINALDENNLVEIITIEETHFLQSDQISDFEKMIRMHYDLGINMEGIEAISHLLKRVHDMQTEIRILRNKLEPL